MQRRTRKEDISDAILIQFLKFRKVRKFTLGFNLPEFGITVITTDIFIIYIINNYHDTKNTKHIIVKSIHSYSYAQIKI